MRVPRREMFRNEETTDLMSLCDLQMGRSSDSNSPSPRLKRRLSNSHCRAHPSNWKLGCSVLLSLLSLLYATQRKSRRTDSLFALDQPVIHVEYRTIDPASRPALYQCPEADVERNAAENIVAAPLEHHLWYEAVSERISNISAYMATFREMEFDNWGHTYDEVKHGMFPWKSHYFTELRSGDMIYESACGIGMNLFMTLEILQQVIGVTNITIYGNDYVTRSVEVAEAIFREPSVSLPKSFGSIGSICAADSTQLDFVPSNSFDLVYTGYISPLFDPLHLNHSTTDETFVQYNAYCEQEDSSFRQTAQQRQNDWYGAWVGEMIRIAKPGAPIIVEQVSYPLCDAIFDWGGVAPEFWKDAIKTYDWDVNRSSIEMQPDSLFRKRYHVFMRKKKGRDLS